MQCVRAIMALNTCHSILIALLFLKSSVLAFTPAANTSQPKPVMDLSRLKSRLDKLLTAPQSNLLNELFADFLFRSFVMNYSLEQLFGEKVKLPRLLQEFLGSHDTTGVTSTLNGTAVQRSQGEVDANLQVKGSKLLAKKIKTATGGGNSLANLIGRCYEPYGCFRITEPFRIIYRPINLIPEPPSTIKVSFHLRTRANPSIAEYLHYNENSEFLPSKHFRPSRPLKLIVHGYLESHEEAWIQEMSAALLNNDDFNVISVDWMLGATPPYTQAVANTRLVGAIIAHLIKVLQNTYPGLFDPSHTHIIGHSLGAHIAGYAGESIPGLAHITGLDPAEPYFQHTEPSVRLDPSDAKFVDVIHTDSASIINGGFGMNQTCGHVDFYPNGGINQPGCKETPIKNALDSISKERTVFDGPFMAYACRSYEDLLSGQCIGQLLHETNCHHSNQTTGCPIRMGLNSFLDYERQHTTTNVTSEGLIYFLQTNDRPPFCQYHYSITLALRILGPPRYYRGYRSRSFVDWLSSGKLYVDVVGTRARAQGEIDLKEANLSQMGHTWLDRLTSDQLVSHHYQLTSTDLGRILRVELEWRPTGPSQRTLNPKTLRRWLPPFSVIELSSMSLLPSVFGDIQRSLNTTNSPYRTLSNEIVQSLHTGKLSLEMITKPPLVKQRSMWRPLLEAVIIGNAEHYRRDIFCVHERPVRALVGPRASSAILIDSSEVSRENLALSLDKLVDQLC